MIHVHAGTDVYGAVRSVNRTPIVTKFAMLQFLPIYPLESYYLRRLGKEVGPRSIFFGGLTERAIVGIPCNRFNRLSVAIAYVRALGAALTVVGAMGVFGFVVGSLCDATFRFNGERQILIIVVGSILAAGLLVALPTYLFTFIVPARDRRIRQACARVLGIAADPANVKAEIANEMAASAEESIRTEGIPELDVILSRPKDYGLHELDMWLVRTRAQVQACGESENHEKITDQILHALAAIEEESDRSNRAAVLDATGRQA
jgi:hypothetical protein